MNKKVYIHGGWYEILDESGNDVHRKTRFKKVIGQRKGNIKVEYVKETEEGDRIPILKRKYNHILTEIVRIVENDIFKKELVVSENVTEDVDGMPTLVLEINDNGTTEGRVKLSHRKMWKLIKSMSDYYTFGDEREELDINLSNETLVIIAIIKSPTGSVTKSDLSDYGVKRSTAQGTLKGMENRGIIQKCGKVGKEDLYEFTVPRHKLAEMFKPYKEEIE